MKRPLSDTKRKEKLRKLKMDDRDWGGRFLKGRPNPFKKSFSKDYNVHTPQIYWDKEWLIKEYIKKYRSIDNIAEEFKVCRGTIKYWLRRHNVHRTNKD